MRELYQKNKLFFLVLFTLILGFLIWYFREIVIFIIIAAVISIIGAPLVEVMDKIRIKKFKLPHAFNVSVTLILILALFFGIFSFFIPLIVNEAGMISNIDMQKLMDYFREDIAWIQSTLIRYGVMPHGATIESSIKESILKIIDFGMFSNIITSVISFTGSFIVTLFAILFLSFFFLLDQNMLPRFLLMISPGKYKEQMKNVMSRSKKLLSRYFIGLIVQITLNIITYSLALYIVGVKSPLAIGFFTGIIIIIPYLGGIISMVVGVVLGVTGVISVGEYSQILPMIIKILVAMGIVQLIDNNVFAPLIQGKSVKAHPVEIFLVVIAAASLGGMLGMVVAVPAYGFIKIVASEFLTNFKKAQGLPERNKDREIH
jgi:predicted PurR-regulated permease PerM